MFSAPPSYSTTLLAFMKRKASPRYRILSLLVGTILFLLLLPTLFFALGQLVNRVFPLEWPPEIEIGMVYITIPLGLFFLVGATLTQWRIGQGTPAPNAPTQRLVVEGPYKLCRNPIQLGAVLYYAGTGSLFGDLSTGLVCLLLVLIVGGGYHKFVEEKELELRFGAAYSAYRRQTPFLIPRIWKR